MIIKNKKWKMSRHLEKYTLSWSLLYFPACIYYSNISPTDFLYCNIYSLFESLAIDHKETVSSKNQFCSIEIDRAWKSNNEYLSAKHYICCICIYIYVYIYILYIFYIYIYVVNIGLYVTYIKLLHYTYMSFIVCIYLCIYVYFV